ncbi:outer arm dynein light chain 1 [Rhizoclosmatium globosum]|uniref:Outer arm dynein light chain 1 n=1 Tax=Rhizoclosmatium globosum TaxID=329046 RepID=A0A1Y2CJ38_9FUNG|nr:outer arm dynein light chain 1 [Rhizoclosmatium globosum]|eukprot:ORY47053.1 outer arm dynein light chain 1 [Rhizoclosmatium globosum]
MLARPPRRFFGRDARENTKMTPKYLKQLCLEQQAYATPELNDKIYLHFKGFADIENLEKYTGLRSLWLEGNGLSQIKNLEALTELRCLFLHQNCIQVIENLDALQDLDTINLGNNLIKSISGLSGLPKLKTLQMDHNYLKSAQDIMHLLECPSLEIVDLSFNQIEDPEVLEVFEKMPELCVLNIMSNPVIPKIMNYRRTMVSRLKKLTYLDDRPVFDKERLATEAWALGGMEAEREERTRQREEERKEHDRNFEALKKIQEEARARRIEKYGPEEETPELADPRLVAFRDEQLSKIEEKDPNAPENEKNDREERDYAETRAEMSKLELLTSFERDLLEEIEEEQGTKETRSGPTITELEDEEKDDVPALEFHETERKRVSFADADEIVEAPKIIEVIEETTNEPEKKACESIVEVGKVEDAPSAVLEHLLDEGEISKKVQKLSVHAWGADE